MGLPGKELQAEFDATNKHVAERRAKFWGKNSIIVPVDPTKLSEEGKAHRARIATPPPPSNVSQLDAILGRIKTIHRPTRSQVMPFEEAKIVVEAIYENELLNRARVPIWTPQNRIIIDDVTRYFIGDPTGPLPLEKGLFVYGPVGVGKTYLFRMMSILAGVVPINPMRFSLVSTKRLLRNISDEKSLKPLHRAERGSWLFDDLGEEKKLVKVYGDVENPIDHLISSRNEAYIDSGLITHFTSNKEPDELESIYGTRAEDRIGEMATPILFNGDSLRNPETDEDDEDNEP